jgi:methylmalonyl-CoA mutase N-terminal domain/subunit
MNKHSTTPADCRESDKDWQEKILQPCLERAPERLPQFTSLSGTNVKRLYTPRRQDLDFRRRRLSGQPYTRGIHPTMYRGSSGQCGSSAGSAR